MSTSTTCNSLCLAFTFSACITSVILVIAILTSPRITSHSSSPKSLDNTAQVTNAERQLSDVKDTLVSDSSYQQVPDLLVESNKLLASSSDGEVNLSEETGDKNIVYSSDDSSERPFDIKTSRMAHAPANNVYATKVKIRGQVVHPNLQVANAHESTEEIEEVNSPERGRRLEEKEDQICHKAAVVRCGWMLLKTFKFLEFLPPQQVQLHKCAFRNAFFLCLTKIDNTSCTSIGKIHQPERFRSRLVRTLWDTKECLLG